MKKAVGHFSDGLTHVLEGLRYVKQNPSLIKWVIVPLLIGLMAFAVIVMGGFSLIAGWVAGAMGWVTGGLTWLGLGSVGFLVSILSWVLGSFLWVVYLVLAIYGAYLLTIIAAAPFHSILAERVLVLTGAIENRPFAFGRWLSMTMKMLWVAVLKAIVFLLIGLVIFVCSFIPIINFVSTFAALLIIAFDSMDYSFELKEMSLGQRFRFFQRHFVVFSGSAGFLGLTLLVPGSTLFLIPFSVIGSALRLSQLEGSSRNDSGPNS